MDNDSRPNSDKSRRISISGNTDAGISDDLAEEEDDLHVCKKCSIEFHNIQLYLEHKIKHDNYKVKYCRSDVDKRIIMPKLVQKVVIKKEPNSNQTQTCEQTKKTEEKENEKKIQRGGRGRKKVMEVNTDLVIKEKPVYVCTRCDRKFNRESILRRHKELDHDQEDVDEDLESEPSDDERDAEYRPNLRDIREAQEEEASDVVHVIVEQSADVPQSGEQAPGDADSQTIAGFLSENQSDNQPSDNTSGGQVNTRERTPRRRVHRRSKIAERVLEAAKTRIRKLLDSEDMELRKYACHVCGNRFKEVNVLKTHMLTHTDEREYQCPWHNCQCAFKTKGALKRHIRRHTGERPYPCELCGRTFTESGALVRHMKSRVPCSQKSDNDLPRYGKKWSETTQPPSMKPGTIKIIHKNSNRNSDSTNSEPMSTEVPISTGDISLPEVAGGDTISAIVHVLEGDLQRENIMLQVEEVEASEVEGQEGVEVVIDSGEGVDPGLATVDSSLDQFVEAETEIEDSASISTTCKVCGEDYISVEALQIHLRSHLADTAFRCWQCHYVTENNIDFENHMFSQHHLQLKSLATALNMTLPQTDNKKMADTDDSHREAQVALKQLLELPREVNDASPTGDRRLYKCPVCLKRFRGVNYLKLHMRNHTDLRPHKCSLCDKAFITKDTLNKHMSVHVEERHFKCGECGKLFKRLSHVREHLRIHSTMRPFQCNVCEKSFKTNNAMKVHHRTHTDIFPYECNFCHRRFRERGSIQRHTRIHTGDKPYECSDCGRRFAEHGTLGRHLKAKVSCKQQVPPEETVGGAGEAVDIAEYPTVLAEFSSVVADTQQYIVPQPGESTLVEQVGQVINEAQQAAQFVVIQTDGEGDELQNLEIITDDGDTGSLVEGVQVTDNYIVMTDEEGMRVVNSVTGETLAMVPITSGDTTGEVQTITIQNTHSLTEVPLTESGVTSIQVAEEMMDVSNSETTTSSLLEAALETATPRHASIGEVTGDCAMVENS